MAVQYYFRSLISVAVLFAIIYHSCNWINAQRESHYSWYFHWELELPLWSWTMIFYLSVYILILLPVFYLAEQQLLTLKRKMQTAILSSGILFIIFPTKLGFLRTEKTDYFESIYQLMYTLDQPYNLFPSLHISLSMLLILSIAQGRTLHTQVFYGIWMLCIMISVITVHQHHLIDIVGALVLTAFIHKQFTNKNT